MELRKRGSNNLNVNVQSVDDFQFVSQQKFANGNLNDKNKIYTKKCAECKYYMLLSLRTKGGGRGRVSSAAYPANIGKLKEDDDK